MQSNSLAHVTGTNRDHRRSFSNVNYRRNHMTTRTHNRFTRSFLLAGATLLLGSGSVFAAAGDAQEQARNMLTGVAGDNVSFPVRASDATQVDPQVQAQWLLAGKAQNSAGTASNESHKTVVAAASASDLARRLLAGKGS